MLSLQTPFGHLYIFFRSSAHFLTGLFVFLDVKLYKLWDINPLLVISFANIFSYSVLSLFSCSVMSDYFQPLGLQHARLPCPSLSPRVCANSCHAIQPSHPQASPSPWALNLSQHQGLFQWVSSLHQVAKVFELQFSISPFSEYSWLISFRIDWFDLLAVQGTLKSLLQHHSSKAST